MIPGPHPSEVASYGAFVTVNRGRDVLSTGTDVVEGALEINGSDTVPEALSFTVPKSELPTHPRGTFAPYGQTVTPSWRAVTHDGVETVIRRAPMLLTGWDASGRIRATGLLARVDEAPWALPSSPRPGATLREEAQRLVGNELPVVVEGANPVLPSTLAWGGDRMKSLLDLCAAYGLRPLVKADGQLHLVDAEQSGRDMVARYSTDRDVIEVSGGEQRERHNIFKVFAKPKDARSDVPEGRPVPGTVIATERITTGPLAVSTYGERSIIRELEAGTSYYQCQREAVRMMREEMAALGTVQASIVADPRLEVGDIISVTTPSRIVVGRVIKLSIPMRHSDSMRVDLQEVAY